MTWVIKITDQDGKTFFSKEYYNEYEANKEALKWNNIKGLVASVVKVSDGVSNQDHS